MSQPLPLPEDGQSSSNLLAAIWRRKWLIVLFACVGLGLGYLYHRQQPPAYVTRASIMVLNDKPTSQPNVIMNHLGRNRHHRRQEGSSFHHKKAIILSEAVLQEIVSSDSLKRLPAFSGPYWQTGARRIQQKLSISTIDENARNSNLIDLTYTSDSPQECEAVLPEIIAGYQTYLEKTQENSESAELKDIRNFLKESEKLIEKLRKEHSKILATSDPRFMIYSGKPQDNHFQNLVTDYQANIKRKRNQKVAIENQLHLLKVALSSKDPEKLKTTLLLCDRRYRPVIDDEMHRNGEDSKEEDTDQDGSTALLAEHAKELELHAKLSSKLTGLKIRKKKLLASYGENHPMVLDVDVEIDATKSVVRKNEQDKEAIMRKLEEQQQLALTGGSTIVEVAENRLEELKVELEVIKLGINNKEEHLEETQKLAKEANLVQAKLNAKDEDLKRAKEISKSLHTSLMELDLTNSNETPKQSIQTLSMTKRASLARSKLARNLGAGGVLGMMIGIGLGLLVELSNRTFYSPDEVTDRLGVPVLSHVPSIEISRRARQAIQDSKLDPTLVVHHKPRSRTAEAFRAIRTALFHRLQTNDRKVIQITSPQPSDGKSTVSANLAISIAQAGQRVCLLDGDLRRPTVEKLFGAEPEHSIADILSGRISPTDAILSTETTNLSLLPCGTRPSNPAELLHSTEFADLVRWLGDQFDYVIIDSPPVLAVTDPANIARVCDAVILAFKLRRNVRLSAERTVRALESVGARLLGVIVNNTGDEYGSNSMGYKINDGYNYGYRYGKYAQRYSGYYSTEDEDQETLPLEPPKDTALSLSQSKGPAR